MAVEIERRFRLESAPRWLADCPVRRIAQGYLSAGDGGEVRLRRGEDERELTVKRGRGEVREEVEVALDDFQFEALWPLTESRRIAKSRHLIEVRDDLIAEVDVYDGGLDGLVVAEVEFPSEAAAEAFEPPDWLGTEVTGDRR